MHLCLQDADDRPDEFINHSVLVSVCVCNCFPLNNLGKVLQTPGSRAQVTLPSVCVCVCVCV